MYYHVYKIINGRKNLQGIYFNIVDTAEAIGISVVCAKKLVRNEFTVYNEKFEINKKYFSYFYPNFS